MSGDMLAALAGRIAELAACPPGTALPDDAEAVVVDLLHRLEQGEIRAAQRDHAGTWRAVPWVKQGILVAFRIGYPDAEVMTKEFGNAIPAIALADLERYEAVVKLLVNGSNLEPFRATMLPPLET